MKISLANRLKCAFNSQYKNGFQKLLLIAVHVTKNSRNGGSYIARVPSIIIKYPAHTENHISLFILTHEHFMGWCDMACT